MIEATQRAGGVGQAGLVAGGGAGGGAVASSEGDDGTFVKTLEASMHENSGNENRSRVHTGGGVGDSSGRVKAKSQAASDKRLNEHKAVKLQAGGAEAAEELEAKAIAPGNEVAAGVAVATQGPKMEAQVAGQVADSLVDAVGAKALPVKGFVVASSAAAQEVKPATLDGALGSDAGVSVEAEKLVSGLRAAGDAPTAVVRAVAATAGESASAQVMASAAAQGITGVAHGSAKVSAPVAGERMTAEPAVRPDEARVFEASSGALEVGVANSTHGWLRVRAEVDEGGTVVAQVLAANAGAAEGLHKELPALSAFLAHEQVGVSLLVVHATSASAEAQDAAFSFAQGERGAGGSSGDEKKYLVPDAAENQGLAESSNTPLSLPLPVSGGAMHGGWLSVRV